jgi:hypothetical protein
MGEPELTRSQLGRIEIIAGRSERSNQFMRWGVSITGAGVGAYLLGAPVDVPLFGGLAGLAFASLFTEPSEDERAYAFPRLYTLSPSEVSIDAARRGVTRINSETRQLCNGAALSQR